MTGNTIVCATVAALEVARAGTRPPTTAGRPCCSCTGSGHGAWCWEHWLDAAAAAGWAATAVSLRGHGGSPGRLRTALLRQYADDVVATASALPRPAVLVGHSMGGLVVQQVLARYAARAAVLVAPVPAHPAVASLAAIARRHPLDALQDRGRRLAPAAAGLPLPRARRRRGAGPRGPVRR